MSPVHIDELPPEARARVLRQIGDSDATAPTVAEESSLTLGDPADMTDDQLADVVIECVQKLRRYLPYIRALKVRFDAGERDARNRLRTPIKNCYSWKEFCDTRLDRCDRAVRKALAAPKPQPPETSQKEPTRPWNDEICLDPDAATELYNAMVDLPESRRSENEDGLAFAINYGLSYTQTGGARDGEMSEIPSFLKDHADKISSLVGMPVNYIQCHKWASNVPCHPHRDPSGMVVPMLVLGQERVFRVGGTMPQQYYRTRQRQRPVECHTPEQQILLRHGSLLTFNGGKVLHSMFSADKDAQFNTNGFEWRISILFRYTTPAMRQFGTRGAVEHGSIEQYEQTKRAYREQIGWTSRNEPQPAVEPAPQPINPPTPAEHPSQSHPAPVQSALQRIKRKLTPLLPTGHDGHLELAELMEQLLASQTATAESEDEADVIFLFETAINTFAEYVAKLKARR